MNTEKTEKPDPHKKSVHEYAAMVAAEQTGQRVNPYTILPASDWVPPTTAYVISTPEGFIKSVCGFCYNLRIWHTNDGLTLDELKAIYRTMKRPEVMASMRYGEGEHLRIFAGHVAEAARQRRMEAAARERRLREQLAEEEWRKDPQRMGELLEGMFAAWGKRTKEQSNEGS